MVRLALIVLAVPPYLGCTELYLGPIAVLWGPKRGPGVGNTARPQPSLRQGGGNVGYKSACHLLEMATRFCAL